MKTLIRTTALALFGLCIALTACAEGAPANEHSGTHAPTADMSSVHPEGDSYAGHGSEKKSGHDDHMVSEEASTGDAEPALPENASASAPDTLDEAASTAAEFVPLEPAAAHAPSKHQMKVTTSIADRSTVSGEVTNLLLNFDHPVRLTGASLSTLAGDTIAVQFDSRQDTNAVTVTFDRLEPDDYFFTWRADAGDHEMSGTLRFGVEE